MSNSPVSPPGTDRGSVIRRSRLKISDGALKIRAGGWPATAASRVRPLARLRRRWAGRVATLAAVGAAVGMGASVASAATGSGYFSAAGSGPLAVTFVSAAEAPLPNGDVLIAGGAGPAGISSGAQVFDPSDRDVLRRRLGIDEHTSIRVGGGATARGRGAGRRWAELLGHSVQRRAVRSDDRQVLDGGRGIDDRPPGVRDSDPFARRRGPDRGRIRRDQRAVQRRAVRSGDRHVLQCRSGIAERRTRLRGGGTASQRRRLDRGRRKPHHRAVERRAVQPDHRHVLAHRVDDDPAPGRCRRAAAGRQGPDRRW